MLLQGIPGSIGNVPTYLDSERNNAQKTGECLSEWVSPSALFKCEKLF